MWLSVFHRCSSWTCIRSLSFRCSSVSFPSVSVLSDVLAHSPAEDHELQLRQRFWLWTLFLCRTPQSPSGLMEDTAQLSLLRVPQWGCCCPLWRLQWFSCERWADVMKQLHLSPLKLAEWLIIRPKTPVIPAGDKYHYKRIYEKNSALFILSWLHSKSKAAGMTTATRAS